jgi:hypothetical protein
MARVRIVALLCVAAASRPLEAGAAAVSRRKILHFCTVLFSTFLRSPPAPAAAAISSPLQRPAAMFLPTALDCTDCNTHAKHRNSGDLAALADMVYSAMSCQLSVVC